MRPGALFVSSFFSPLFGERGTDGSFFLLLQKETAWQKKKKLEETFRMVSTNPFQRPRQKERPWKLRCMEFGKNTIEL